MSRYRHSQILLNIVYGLFIFCVAHSRPPLMGSLCKLVAALLLTCLLAFVVVHSGNLCKLVIACLHALPARFFLLAMDWQWNDRSLTPIPIPNRPSLSPLFQRPPPVLSL